MRLNRLVSQFQQRLILFGIVVCGLIGCATITRSGVEAYQIESAPSGARVRASTGWACITPCERQIKRKSSFSLDIEKAGYRSIRVLVRAEIESSGRAGLAGNILFGGLIGAAIDSGTGAMYSHAVNPLVVQLEKAGTQTQGEAFSQQ